MSRNASIALRLLLLLAALGIGPLVVKRLNQMALWTEDFIELGAVFPGDAGGARLLFAIRDVGQDGDGQVAIAPAGDVDGDGRADLAVIAADEDEARGGTFALRSGASGEALHQWRLPDSERAPHSVAVVGDHDGDGVPDVLVGQGADDGWRGRVYWICSGRTGRTLLDVQRFAGPGWPLVRAVGDATRDALLDLGVEGPGGAALHDARDGRRIGSFGSDTGALGSTLLDVDGDGEPEVAVLRFWGALWGFAPDSEPPSTAPGAGIAGGDEWIVEILALDGRRLQACTPSFEPFVVGALAFALVPDLDGDGAPDLVIGAPGVGAVGEGAVRAYSGKSGAFLWERLGDPGDALGTALVALGDLDGDGHGDLAVGAPGPDRGIGVPAARHVVPLSALGYGPAPLVVSPAPPAASLPVSSGAVLVLSGADGTPLSRIGGTTLAGRFGRALTAADVDGDGTLDLVIEEPNAQGTAADGTDWRGTAWIFSGASLVPPR